MLLHLSKNDSGVAPGPRRPEHEARGLGQGRRSEKLCAERRLPERQGIGKIHARCARGLRKGGYDEGNAGATGERAMRGHAGGRHFVYGGVVRIARVPPGLGHELLSAVFVLDHRGDSVQRDHQHQEQRYAAAERLHEASLPHGVWSFQHCEPTGPEHRLPFPHVQSTLALMRCASAEGRRT